MYKCGRERPYAFGLKTSVEEWLHSRVFFRENHVAAASRSANLRVDVEETKPDLLGVIPASRVPPTFERHHMKLLDLIVLRCKVGERDNTQRGASKTYLV